MARLLGGETGVLGAAEVVVVGDVRGEQPRERPVGVVAGVDGRVDLRLPERQVDADGLLVVGVVPGRVPLLLGVEGAAWTLPLASTRKPAAGTSSSASFRSRSRDALKVAWAWVRAWWTPLASLAASSNSWAVFATNGRATPAVTPLHSALSALAFIPLRAASASSSSLAAIACQSATAVWSLSTGAFRTFSYVSTGAAYLRYSSSLEVVNSA